MQHIRRVTGRFNIKTRGVDVALLGSVILLSVFGIFMVYNASVAISLRDFADPWYYAREQLRGLAIGLVLFSVFSFIDYHTWRRYALYLLLINMVLLLVVFIPGIGIKALGAHRWIKIGMIVIQPAEFAKFTLIVYLASWLSNKERNRLWAFVLFLAMYVGLVLLEPDMGTSIILSAIALLMYFFSGAPMKHFLMLLPMMIAFAVIFAVTSPYRFARLGTFTNPSHDPLGSSYQIRQALLAIGSGGLSGVGLGMSRQKYEYLPEANTDSVFAVYAEETGFLGSSLLISLYIFILYRGFTVVRYAPDGFGKLLAGGCVGMLGFQSALNICAMLALAPLTGIPLPFLSYGSSSLVVMLASMGIVLNISRYRQPE